MNQSMVGRAAGVAPSMVSRWMQEAYDPSMEAALKLCEAFNVSLSQLMGQEPINRIDGIAKLSSEDEEFIRRYQAADDKLRALVRSQFEGLESLLDMKE